MNSRKPPSTPYPAISAIIRWQFDPLARPYRSAAGYGRPGHVKDMVYVSRTTATHSSSRCVAPGNAGAQATCSRDKIAASLSAAGGQIENV
jgi:enamine deaminase RidA (YjgF/YER057c/UK114 family)